LAQGLTITLCSDIRIAAKSSKFGWPQAKVGISSMGGPAFAVHCLPRNYGYEYLLTGELFNAQDAFRLGMVNRVVPEDKLMSAAEEMARKILSNAPLAVQGIKAAASMGLEISLYQRLRVAETIQDRVMKTKDAQEGLLAFKEKRAPLWRGE